MGNGNKITVTVKLYSGLDRELSFHNYNRERGIPVEIASGTRLRKILKSLGMKRIAYNAYFLNGDRIGIWKKIEEDSEISCMKPAGGG